VIRQIYNGFLSGVAILCFSILCFDDSYINANTNQQSKQFETLSSQVMSDELLSPGDNMVIPSGEPIGIYVKTKGVMVIDTTSFSLPNGKNVYPSKGKFLPGDYITQINGEAVEDKKSLIEKINSSEGAPLDIRITRDNKEIYVTVVPEKSSDGNYMLGLWVKDDISGIGTLTFIDEEGFGALGHSINDNDTGSVFTISDGAIYETELVNITRAQSGTPGRLEGMIDYSKDNVMGRVKENTLFGIRGIMTKKGATAFGNNQWMPTAQSQEVHLGDAYILSSLSGESVYYDIEIVDIDFSKEAGNKSLEIKITDQQLIDLTGGIVQGMSGTPIIQDGKLIGAITHVMVNDPSRGYGIFIESMLNHGN